MSFPEVQGGGSLILAWQIRGKHVLVVGGGEVAAGRILNCLNADARVTVVCPRAGLNAEVAYRVQRGQVRHIDRLFEPCDLDGAAVPRSTSASSSPPNEATNVEEPPPPQENSSAGLPRNDSASGSVFAAWSSTLALSTNPSSSPKNDDPDRVGPVDMVLVAIDDPAASSLIWRLCKDRRIPANIADVPSECDFYFGSVHRAGPLQIMVSTNGKGPRLAAMIRRWIAERLPPHAENAIETVGSLRAKLRSMAPGPEEGPKRMAWMTKVCDTYAWEELCEMTSEDMDNLLRFYPSLDIPPSDALRTLRNEAQDDVFDGSFGFSVGI